MKRNRQRLGPGAPPPLVPQSIGGWLVPLGKAALAAIGVILCYSLVYIPRQWQMLAEAAARHH